MKKILTPGLWGAGAHGALMMDVAGMDSKGRINKHGHTSGLTPSGPYLTQLSSLPGRRIELLQKRRVERYRTVLGRHGFSIWGPSGTNRISPHKHKEALRSLFRVCNGLELQCELLLSKRALNKKNAVVEKGFLTR